MMDYKITESDVQLHFDNVKNYIIVRGYSVVPEIRNQEEDSSGDYVVNFGFQGQPNFMNKNYKILI